MNKQIIYGTGDVYQGRIVKQGRGKMKYLSGDEYEGNWKNDMKNGRGVMKYADGYTYKGNWFNDKKHGDGILVGPNNYLLIGKWENDILIKKLKK